MAILLDELQAARKQFNADPTAAGKLLAVGSSPASDKLPAPELAAWTTLTSLILNLDETISKP